MLGRFSPIELFRGHMKGLSDYRRPRTIPDRATQVVLLAIPVAVGLAMIAKRGQLVAPGSLLAGVALLAGGILSTFTHLSTLRLRMTERAESWGDAERSDRDAIDETAAHLLLAAYLAGVTALLIVLGMNIGVGPNGEVAWGWSAAIAVVGSYMFLLFLIAVPKLYNAYTVINRVRDELNGAVRGSRPR